MNRTRRRAVQVKNANEATRSAPKMNGFIDSAYITACRALPSSCSTSDAPYDVASGGQLSTWQAACKVRERKPSKKLYKRETEDGKAKMGSTLDKNLLVVSDLHLGEDLRPGGASVSYLRHLVRLEREFEDFLA